MVVAIIQARIGSTRLPGKVLKKVAGRPLLEYMIERAKKAKTLDAIILATTIKKEDAKLSQIAKRQKIDFFQGSEADVLDRYYQAATRAKARTIVRLTGDCPLIDPEIIDRVVSLYMQNQRRYDYVSNVRPPTFPDGMDVEVFSYKTLQKMWKEAGLPSEREHVTAYVGNHPELFRVGNVLAEKDFSHLRLTVDTKEDMRLIEKLVAVLWKKGDSFRLPDIIAALKRNPKLSLLNAHIGRNEGYAKSVRKDPAYSITLRKKY